MTMKPLGLSLSGIPGPSPERIRSDLLRHRRELYGLPDVVGALAGHADALHLVEIGVVPRSVFDRYFWPVFHILHPDAFAIVENILLNGTADRPPRGILPIETIQTMTQEDHRQIHSQYNPNPFCYSRPDILDAHIYAMRAVCHFGIDLGEGRDFAPTED